MYSVIYEYRTRRGGQILLTEIVSPGDPRASSKQMKEARKQELRESLERGTFKVVLMGDISKDANFLTGLFVLPTKSKEDGETKFKARYVFGGHRNSLKYMMVYTSQTVLPSSIRILPSLASMQGVYVRTADVRQAYFHAALILKI